MSSSKTVPPPFEAFNDVLARMMQAEVNEGGPPPATPCDTPVEVLSHIHMAEPKQSSPGVDDAMQFTKKEFEQTLTKQLEQIREELHALRMKGAAVNETVKAKWRETLAALEAKQRDAEEKLDAVTTSSGKAWEHLRDGAKHAWEELERAVQKARSEF